MTSATSIDPIRLRWTGSAVALAAALGLLLVAARGPRLLLVLALVAGVLASGAGDAMRPDAAGDRFAAGPLSRGIALALVVAGALLLAWWPALARMPWLLLFALSYAASVIGALLEAAQSAALRRAGSVLAWAARGGMLAVGLALLLGGPPAQAGR